MRKFTTKLKLDKMPLILQGMEDFIGKIVNITIIEVETGEPKKKNNNSLKLKHLMKEGYQATKEEDNRIMKDFETSDFENID